MNKLFSKVATLSVGLAMAIGVGVAVGSKGVKAVKADYSQLYTANFTDVATHSYTQNKTFTLNGKSWTSSVSQVNSSVFYLGCNNNNASKGVLGNNTAFSDVNTALADADDAYVSGTSHAYALLFDNAYDNVSKVEFTWAGGNNAFQIFLFGKSGSDYSLLASVDYATSGASVAGSIEWTGSATNYSSFAVVARPGTATSPVTSKTLRASTFSIFKNQDGPSVYTVTYDANGGTGSMVDETEYESGDKVTVRYCKFMPADSFHEFNSFNTKADGSGTSYMGGAQFDITGNVTLYAQWDIKDVTLPNGSYNSSVSYVKPMPTALDILDKNSTKVGLLEVDTSNVTYKENYKEFDIAAQKSLVITNHSNAVITTVLFEVYNFDNIDVFVDGNSEAMHHGDGSNIGDHTKIELDVNASSTVEIKGNGGNNGSRSQSFYGFEVLMKVGSEVIHPSSVELNAESGNVYIGKTKQLTATVLPADADDKTVSWSSDNTAVATVADGLVTGVAAGTATITVTTNDGGKTATFVATVKELSYGTLESPLSVEEARDVLDVTGSSVSAEKLYVTGVVYSSSYDSSHSNYTIWLKNSEGTVDKYFELYGTTISNAYSEIDFTSSNALKGLTVVCYGYGKIYNTTYELTFVSSDYPEIQVISYTAEELAAAILADTKAKCDAYVDKESSYDEYKSAFESVWAKLAIRYSVLSESDKSALANADRDEKGTVVEQAMARYDFLTGKYELSNFINGRTPIVTAMNIGYDVASANNTAIIVIIIVATSALAFTTLLVFKKKKQK